MRRFAGWLGIMFTLAACRDSSSEVRAHAEPVESVAHVASVPAPSTTAKVPSPSRCHPRDTICWDDRLKQVGWRMTGDTTGETGKDKSLAFRQRTYERGDAVVVVRSFDAVHPLDRRLDGELESAVLRVLDWTVVAVSSPRRDDAARDEAFVTMFDEPPRVRRQFTPIQ